jgi:predicted permease
MGTLGALGGVLLAMAGAPALLHLLDRPEAPARLALTPDWRLFGFVLALGAGATLSFGLAPALRACGSQPNRGLRGMPESRSLAGRALLSAQVALSFVLVAAGLLFTLSLRNLLTLPAGFERRDLLLAEIDRTGPAPSEASQRATWEQIRLRVAELPRVRTCGYSLWGFFSGSRRTYTLLAQGDALEVVILPVSPDFFETMGTAILRGREFAPGDAERAVQPVIVNQAFARLWSGGENPLGRVFPVAGVRSEIVGLSEDAKYGNLREKAPAMIYVPVGASERITFAIRTPEAPAEMAARLRGELARIGGNLQLRQVRTQSEIVGNTLARERLLAGLSSFFALTGMALACLGVFGVLSYQVSRRTREIGIRSALGATRGRIARAVFGRVSVAFGLGLGAGAALTAGLARFAEHMLYGIHALSPLPFFLAGGILTAAALLAAAIPALRASRVDASLALRHT